jgi:hypothetical protein
MLSKLHVLALYSLDILVNKILFLVGVDSDLILSQL